MRTVVLQPAAEIAHRRYREKLPGFDKAYQAVVSPLTADPERRREFLAGCREYRLARSDRACLHAPHTFDLGEILISELEAF